MTGYRYRLVDDTFRNRPRIHKRQDRPPNPFRDTLTSGRTMLITPAPGMTAARTAHNLRCSHSKFMNGIGRSVRTKCITEGLLVWTEPHHITPSQYQINYPDGLPPTMPLTDRAVEDVVHVFIDTDEHRWQNPQV